jgi:putative proteasome-type protease
MDSTMRSNLTVGPPIEVLLYKANSFDMQTHYRFNEDSPFLRDLKKSWDNKLKEAFHRLPPLRLDEQTIEPTEETAGY